MYKFEFDSPISGGERINAHVCFYSAIAYTILFIDSAGI